jgi:hypothetical protein
MWFDGTVVSGDSRTRGNQNQNPYCVFDISDGVLTQAYIQSPTAVYLLLDNLIDEGLNVDFGENYDDPVVSAENIVFYLYEVEVYTIDSDNTGSTLTFDIADRTYNNPSWPGPTPGCNDQPTVMDPITVGTCSVNIETSDLVNGIFTYDFPTSLYDFCSNSRETSGNNYIYTVVITIPGVVGSCKYFNTQDQTRTSLITIRKNKIDPESGPQGTVVTLGVQNYTIELCPQLTYVVPRAKSVFVLNYTYTGAAISWSSAPYLDTPNDPLNMVGTSCTTFTDGSPNICIYTVKSSVCMPLLSFSGATTSECAFESSFSKTLFELDVTQIIDPVTQVSGTKEFPILTTALGYEVFDDVFCVVGGGGTGVTNVTSQFQSVVKIRNRPYPDWDTPPTTIKFYEDMIIQVELPESGASQTSQVHITSVVFHIYHPDTGLKINEFTFNKADKEVLHAMDWTRFYDDVHFCSYQYTNGTCEPYYTVGTGRVNDFTLYNIIPKLHDVCQTDQNSTINDHFSFSPSKWFKRINVPKVDVEMAITSVLVVCNTGSRRLETTTTINFVSSDTQAQADTGVGRQRLSVRVIEDPLLTYGDDPTDTVVIIVLLFMLIVVAYFAFNKQVAGYSPI